MLALLLYLYLDLSKVFAVFKAFAVFKGSAIVQVFTAGADNFIGKPEV